MIKYARVFIYIAMLLRCIMIFPIFLGLITLNKINTAQNKRELQPLGIIDIFFLSILSGIFVLMINDDDLNKNRKFE